MIGVNRKESPWPRTLLEREAHSTYAKKTSEHPARTTDRKNNDCDSSGSVSETLTIDECVSPSPETPSLVRLNPQSEF